MQWVRSFGIETALARTGDVRASPEPSPARHDQWRQSIPHSVGHAPAVTSRQQRVASRSAAVVLEMQHAVASHGGTMYGTARGGGGQAPGQLAKSV